MRLLRIRPDVKLLTLVALALASLAVPSTTAHAAAPTCQGEEATIVGTNGYAAGTDGNDVIVVTGVDSNSGVDAKGGDDLVCVDGQLPEDSFGGGPGVSGGAGHDSLEVRLADGNDWLEIYDVEDLDVAMGGGFDEVRLYRNFGTGSIDAGPQGGVIKMASTKVDVDLEDHVLRFDGGAGDYEIKRFFRVFASGDRVSLTGDAKDNGFRASACRLTMRGGKGDDLLQAYKILDGDNCRGARLLGLKGDDRLEGTSGDDTLIGGPGFDKSNGKQGNDKCDAERKTGCER